jgi:HEAT repeat protein
MEGPWAVEPLIFSLENDSNEVVRTKAMETLGAIGDRRAVKPLKTAFEKEKDECARISAAAALYRLGEPGVIEYLLDALRQEKSNWNHVADVFGETGEPRAVTVLINLIKTNEVYKTLGKIGDKRAVLPLITALKKNKCFLIDLSLLGLLNTLGELRDTRAVKPVISVLKNCVCSFNRGHAAAALGMINDTAALEPLICALENDLAPYVRSFAAEALGMIGDKQAIGPLLKAMRNDTDYVCTSCTYALASFETAEIEKALRKEVAAGNNSAAIVLALQYGGADLEKLQAHEPPYDKYLLDFIKASWGNASALEGILVDFSGNAFSKEQFYRKLFARMPQGFPAFDFKAKYQARKKRAKAIREWYEKNKSRIVWDKENKNYELGVRN